MRGLHDKQNIRSLAIDILIEWHRTREPLHHVVERRLGPVSFADPRDGQLARAIVYGAVRWQGYLDWVIRRFSRYPLGKMKPRTLAALRTGLFQLLFMDRIPPAAAINETVQAMKRAGQPRWITGFINGLLRTVERGKAELPDPVNLEDTTMPLWSRLSCPDWLFDRWRKHYGRETAITICRENNQRPPLVLRLRSDVPVDRYVKLAVGAGIGAEPGTMAPGAVRISGYQGLVADLPGYREGLFQVQDEAAQLVSLLLAPGERQGNCLDACAGLGGKTSHLAAMLPPGGRLIALEPNSRRARLLADNLERLAISSRVEVVETDLEGYAGREVLRFSSILVDAPCSGTGVIRRHPDIRWNRGPGDLKRYQQTQLALLDNAARLCGPAGVLVYATCSIEPEENDEVVGLFLERHPEYAVGECKRYLPPGAAGLVDVNGFFRTRPGSHGLDGFFAARLEKVKD